jgi:hypothetical protein
MPRALVALAAFGADEHGRVGAFQMRAPRSRAGISCYGAPGMSQPSKRMKRPLRSSAGRRADCRGGL